MSLLLVDKYKKIPEAKGGGYRECPNKGSVGCYNNMITNFSGEEKKLANKLNIRLDISKVT